MSIRITQPFSFDSKKPNFERDIINSSTFESQDPLFLNTNERNTLAGRYDVGHIVWDVNTRRHYRVEYTNNLYCLVPIEPIALSTSEWYGLDSDEYIPQMGEVIIFTDYMSVDGENVPMFKVGDGIHTPMELPFAATPYAGEAGVAEVAKRVEHPLHIGPHDYDGSVEVTVGIFDSDDYTVH